MLEIPFFHGVLVKSTRVPVSISTRNRYGLVIGINDLATVYPKVASEWNHEKNEKGPQYYPAHSGKRAFWICSECGYSWDAIIENRTRHGNGCPACSGRVPRPGINDLATLRPDLLPEWNYEKNEKGPEQYTVHSGQIVFWNCLKCKRSWKAQIASRSAGHGCPFCSGLRVKVGETDLLSNRPELVPDWNFDKNKKGPQDYTVFSTEKVHWTCSKCGNNWIDTIAHRSSGRGCSKCKKNRNNNETKLSFSIF